MNLVLLICVTKVTKSAFDKALAKHEDIDDAVGSEEPTERDHGGSPAAASSQDRFLRQPSKMKPTLEDEYLFGYAYPKGFDICQTASKYAEHLR
ncbi:hypothetical protein OROHE_023332 [Orobanche hederae]